MSGCYRDGGCLGQPRDWERGCGCAFCCFSCCPSPPAVADRSPPQTGSLVIEYVWMATNVYLGAGACCRPGLSRALMGASRDGLKQKAVLRLVSAVNFPAFRHRLIIGAESNLTSTDTVHVQDPQALCWSCKSSRRKRHPASLPPLVSQRCR